MDSTRNLVNQSSTASSSRIAGSRIHGRPLVEIPTSRLSQHPFIPHPRGTGHRFTMHSARSAPLIRIRNWIARYGHLLNHGMTIFPGIGCVTSCVTVVLQVVIQVVFHVVFQVVFQVVLQVVSQVVLQVVIKVVSQVVFQVVSQVVLQVVSQVVSQVV